jgi:hypothetical protein
MPGMENTMHEFKEGTLKSGSGDKVTERKQAIAIGMSEEGKSKQHPTKSKIMKKHMKRAHKEWDGHPDNPHNGIRM